MKKLETYLAFTDNCEEALNFYKECLDGEITEIKKFGDGPMEVEEKDKDRVMHARFKAGDITFMASDSMPGSEVKSGDQVKLSVALSDEKEQEEIFNNLSRGGNVTFQLQNTFWGSKFGMLVDKFGIHWMLSVEKEQS